MSAEALACEGLVTDRGGRRVLDGVTLTFDAGCWTAVVGPNGAGKSTLLAVLAGLLAPASGGVRLQGRGLADWPACERAQALAWLAQAGEADGDIAVRDVVRLGRLPRHGLLGSPDAADEAAVDAAMAETACTALATRRLNALSGGERQRVLLARVLAVAAPVMLLDEPTTHLDAPHQRALCRGLRARTAAGGAVVTVMHDLTLALGADRIVVVHAGRVAALGSPQDAALRATLAEVFGHAYRFEAVAGAEGPRWVAVPEP